MARTGHCEGDAPAFTLLDQAFREVVGRGTVPARAGGFHPGCTRTREGRRAGHPHRHRSPRRRLHAPNEKLDLKQLWDGIKVFRRFYELLGT